MRYAPPYLVTDARLTRPAALALAAGSASPDAVRQFTEDSRSDKKRSAMRVFAVTDSNAAGKLGDFDAVAAAAG
jgi:hypothetical protein